MSFGDDTLMPLSREEDIVKTLETGLFDGKRIVGVKVDWHPSNSKFKTLSFIFSDGVFVAQVQVR